MKSTNLFLNMLTAAAVLAFSACSDDNGGGDPVIPAENKYVVAATSGENDYLVAGEDLGETQTFDATAATSVQSPGDRTWTFYGKDVVYGFLYNQADAGTTASYVLQEDGTISKRNELALDVSIQTRGEVDGNLILAYSDRLRDTTIPQKAYFYKVDPETDASQAFTLVTDNLLEDGEVAYLTDIAEYEGNMIAGARSIKNSSFGSDYYNNTYIIVFNDDFTVKQVIKDSGRTGFVAGQKYSQGDTGLEVVDSGDLYVFSSGQTNYADAATNIPSGILKINKGQFAFDASYFFDITAASEGHNLFRTYYMGGNKFILSMYPGKNDQATFGIDANRFAVVDVSSKSFQWVSGFPTAAGGDADPFLVGSPYIDADAEQLIVPVNTSDGKKLLYTINPATNTASKSSEIIGEGVKAIGILEVKE